MDKVKKTLTKEYQFPFKLNESIISMFLGVVVVLLIGLIAYNYFRTQREVAPATTTAVRDTQTSGQKSVTKNAASDRVRVGQSAVALPTTHTVATGENLWTIAEKYYKSGYNYADLAKINKIPDANRIVVGQKLTIPKVEVRQPLTVADAATPTITTSRIEGGSYTVAQGDTIWEISVRAYGDGYRYTQIVTANKLAHPNLIHAGNVLTIPR